MTTHLWIASALAISLATLGSTQTSPDDRSNRAYQIYEKNIKLDLYNQILPLLFSKGQLRAFLPAIERARQRVRETEKLELDEIIKVEGDIDKALKLAETNQSIPPADLLTRISIMLKKLSLARGVIVEMNTQEVYDAFMKTANVGQQKAAANSLNLALIMPGRKPEDVKDEEKLRIFVRDVLLHPAAYDIMRKLSL